MSDYYDIEIRLRDDLRPKDIRAADTTSIVTKSEPIPLKDVKPDFLTKISNGEYCGHNSILDALSNDTFDGVIGDRVQVVSRWALNIIDPALRNSTVCLETDRHAQFARTHGWATISSGHRSITP